MDENKELDLFCSTNLTKFRKWNKYDRQEMPTIYNCFSLGYTTAWIKYDKFRKIYKVCCTEKFNANIENKDVYKTYYVVHKTTNLEEARITFKKLCITMLTDEE